MGFICWVVSRYDRSCSIETGWPFHSTWSWALIDRTFLTGLIGGGGWFCWFTGRSSFTAWVWIGIVMMNMIRRTSMTSMRGVVLMSTIGSEDSGFRIAALIF